MEVGLTRKVQNLYWIKPRNVMIEIEDRGKGDNQLKEIGD